MKRIVTYLVVAVLLVSAVSTSVSAANYTDTEFSFFSINAEYLTLLEEKRAKEDSSSVYVYFEDYYNPLTVVEVATFGYASGSATGFNVTVSYGEPVNYVTCRKGVEYGIHNWIYERGYSYATLGMQTPGGTDIVSGLWSPDSVGDLVIAH